MRVVVSIIFMFVSSWVSGSEALDRFNLFTDCAAVKFLIEDMTPHAEKISLTNKSVRTAVESRFRSARIYTLESIDNYFYVSIIVGEKFFGVNVRFYKHVFDPVSQVSSYASAWHAGNGGTYGGDANYILAGLSRLVDEFLVEYLRVNEEAC